jgi:hypothetical protein
MKHWINTTIKNNKKTKKKEYKNTKQRKKQRRELEKRKPQEKWTRIVKKSSKPWLTKWGKKGITSYKQERHEHNNNMKHKGACTSRVKVTMQSIKGGHNNTKKHKEKTQQ